MMSSPRPGSYLLSNPSLRSALRLINSESLEKPVQAAWNVIVADWFPTREGYKWNVKAPVLANDNGPGIVVIQLTSTPLPDGGEEFCERPILLIKCKRPSLDTPIGWDDTENAQTFANLSQNLNLSGKLYGAVAIGKKVQFYSVDGQASDKEGRMSRLHSGTIDMHAEGGMLEVERMLGYIKTNAWQWTEPPST